MSMLSSACCATLGLFYGGGASLFTTAEISFLEISVALLPSNWGGIGNSGKGAASPYMHPYTLRVTGVRQSLTLTFDLSHAINS